MALRTTLTKLAFMALAFSTANSSWAGNYGVSPLNLELSITNKSGVLTVTNEDKKDLDIRIRPASWSQSADGQDKYQDANDLVVFPRRLSLKPGEKKIIRVGLNDAQTSTEKAYRVYLEEVAPPADPNDPSVKLSVLINIGIPVFVTPAQAAPKLSVQPMIDNNKLKLQLNNQGNAHIRLSRIADDKGNTITSNFNNRYVFSGVSTSSDIALPASVCNGTGVKWLLETSEPKPIPLNITLPARCNG
jgi:fimbrial chaperone protein